MENGFERGNVHKGMYCCHQQSKTKTSKTIRRSIRVGRGINTKEKKFAKGSKRPKIRKPVITAPKRRSPFASVIKMKQR